MWQWALQGTEERQRSTEELKEDNPRVGGKGKARERKQKKVSRKTDLKQGKKKVDMALKSKRKGNQRQVQAETRQGRGWKQE